MATALTEETLIGVFEHRGDAERAVHQLRDAAFRDDKVGFLARNGDRAKPKSDDDADADATAVTGAAIGATGGAALGAAVVAGVIPVVGPVLAVGALGTILLNAAGGAAVAGMTTALASWGISDDDAKFYESEVSGGKYLVSVEVSSDYPTALRILQNNHASMRRRPR